MTSRKREAQELSRRARVLSDRIAISRSVCRSQANSVAVAEVGVTCGRVMQKVGSAWSGARCCDRTEEVKWERWRNLDPTGQAPRDFSIRKLTAALAGMQPYYGAALRLHFQGFQHSTASVVTATSHRYKLQSQ